MFVIILRSALGLMMLVFGLNSFFNFMEPPSQPPDAGMQFLGALADTGYMWYAIGAVKVLSGALLLFKRWVPFALVLLAPISVNIVLYHAFLDPAFSHSVMAYGVATANLILGAMHWEAYRSLFR